MRNTNDRKHGSNIRLSHKTDVVFPILKEKYHNELSVTLLDNKLYPSYLSTSIEDNMWRLVDSQGLDITYKDKLNICIPFDDLGIASGEQLEFFFVVANSGLRSTFMPKDILISIKRP